jgi:hypothetical protein
MMLSPIGFWSYSNTDDDHSRGRLSQLRALLASELQQKIGRKLKVNIFQDVAAIPPGAEWEKQIRDAIDGSCFLIPIVTPALLQSEWCCQEIALFRQRETTTLRRTDLIFPIHYLNVDDRDSSRPEDCHDAEIFSFLRSRQWTDFRALRHKNPESEDVARRIDALADAICAALRRAERDPYAEGEARQKVTAQAQDRRADNDRRVSETEVKPETVQKRLEADAKRAEEEAKKSAADTLANEMANEARRGREATAERERGQAEQQQAENRSPRSKSEAKDGLGGGQSPDRWPMRLDIRSWSYFRIAVAAALLGLFAFVLGNAERSLLGSSFFLLPRALYAATILFLVTGLTGSLKFRRLAVLFLGILIISVLRDYIVYLLAFQMGLSLPLEYQDPKLFNYVANTTARSLSMLLVWLLVAYAISLPNGFKDRSILAIVLIAGVAISLATIIIGVTLPSEVLGYVISAVTYGAIAVVFTYGIRKQTSQVPLGK